MVFFTDRNLGTNLFPSILEEAGLTVERHDKHFGDTTRDEEWLARVGRERWIAITRDARIRYKPNERTAVVKHQVALLVLIGDAPFADLARNFVATLPKIQRFVAANHPPYIAKVYQAGTSELLAAPTASGRIEKWYP